MLYAIGEEVLFLLSFSDDTAADACFGLGMLLLVFTGTAAIILHFSRMTYIPLGFIGAKYKSKISTSSLSE